MAHPVDVRVGARIRSRRKTIRMSQEALAAALGLTFQQVQKYEKGANRVSASKLFEIASALESSVAFFFEGLEQATDTEDPQEAEVQMFAQSETGRRLILASCHLGARRLAPVMALVESMVQS